MEDVKVRRNRSIEYQNTKDEIESLIDIVTEELNQLVVEKEGSKLFTPNGFNSVRSINQSLLSKSAQRLTNDANQKYNLLKSAIGKAVRVRKRLGKRNNAPKSPNVIDLEV